MIVINYPDPVFQTKKENGKEFIFDKIRRQWIMLTEEEWVRQNFVQLLIQVKNYPASLIAIEKEIQLGELKKRFDILVYDKTHQPWMIIECKGPHVTLVDAVLHQALRYNISVPVPFIIITNGNQTFGWEKKENDLRVISYLPDWK
ncbi:MAG TPA: type I restriction enzyme HsdR N-terminal domain-containing protein [Chitinophagaceae bacterium]|nr:type I restriction enzyme HsdR N-terminal domain-containing protein [Chitinophagaceae bacterium]